MEQRYDPAGRSLLKTTGVLMIVFGCQESDADNIYGPRKTE